MEYQTANHVTVWNNYVQHLLNAALGNKISFKNNSKAEGSCSNMENIKNK